MQREKKLYKVEVIYWLYKDSTFQHEQHDKSKLYDLSLKLRVLIS